MEILRSKIMGFCAGVRRTVNLAENALAEKKDSENSVYTFGPLIHNPVALEKFRKKNLFVLNEDEIKKLKKNDVVIIRAHGVPPKTAEILEKTGAKVINATCPLVQESQKKAMNFAGRGYSIIFLGDKDHGEVVGIEGYAKKAWRESGINGEFILIRSMKDAEKFASRISSVFSGKDSAHSFVLMSQTTFSISLFKEISEFLSQKIKNLVIINSICPATHERQSSLEELCLKADGVLVIGGKNSANTNRLYKTAASLCKEAALIETKDEIPPEFFKMKTVGITAGSSTPDDIIEEVETALRNIDCCGNIEK